MVRLADSLWEELTEDDWIAINVWGGFVLTKPGYQHILVALDEPETRNITDEEFSHLTYRLLEVN